MSPPNERTLYRKAPIYFMRAMRLCCPVCGKHPIFFPILKIRSLHDWFAPLDGCPRCGYPYEREPGYFLVAIWVINYGVASISGIVIYLLLDSMMKISITVLLIAVLTPIGFFNLLFARHAKALFIALDHLSDPHEQDPRDDGGNLPKPNPPSTVLGGPAEPIKSTERKKNRVYSPMTASHPGR